MADEETPLQSSHDQDFTHLRHEVDSLLAHYGSNSFLLYAMGLHLRSSDLEDLRDDNLLDGPDDKKTDFFHLDLDAGEATIAQGYQATDWDKKEPPANKAADLTTAVQWLLLSELDRIPNPAVQSAARQLRDEIASGSITRLNLFYVHNLPSSENVERELLAAEHGINAILAGYKTPSGAPLDCRIVQVGREAVEEWRRSQHDAISIHDEITFTSPDVAQTVDSDEWHAVVASIDATDLVALHARYGEALFSANVRDFLGTRESSRNINREITETARNRAGNFWIFNNGITVLTKAIHVDGKKITLDGIAIINGAQTTGSLATAASQGSVQGARVLVRAIRCNDPILVNSVIRYNNTQNPIKAWELRVIDPIQRRLRDDFANIQVTYQLRRGSGRRSAQDVHYEKLGPFLSAFYGDPRAAHRDKAELFDSETRYRSLFSEDSSVTNLLFVYRLGVTVANVKARLRERVQSETATSDEVQIFSYFRYAVFSYVVIYVCARVLELLLEHGGHGAVAKRVAFTADVQNNSEQATSVLEKLVEVVLKPLHGYLKTRDAFEELRVQAGVEGAAAHVCAIIEQVQTMNPDTYGELTDALTVS